MLKDGRIHFEGNAVELRAARGARRVHPVVSVLATLRNRKLQTANDKDQ